ncbi:hypothetical protein EJB05_37837, partial [Eragrostis curvula]
MGGGGGGGGGDDEEWLPRCPCPADVTIVLVGKVGSGKSATANSILGSKVFASKHSYSSVTKMCQMSRTTRSDGCAEPRTINVIDTPGLFDMSTTTEDTRKEIAKCMEMSKNGIHAMLLVFSADSRFTREDADTIECIKIFFGDSIVNHMILVFTRGDQIGEVNWKDMLADKDASYLQDVAKQCSDRIILFDNKTIDAQHQEEQLNKLLDAVDSVISNNNGIPFSNKMFTQIKEEHDRQNEIGVQGSAEQTSMPRHDIYDGYLMLITKMVEEKLNSTIEKLQKQLMEEQKARQKIESEVAEAKMRSEEEIRKLREELEKAKQDSDKARQFYEKFKWMECAIM